MCDTIKYIFEGTRPIDQLNTVVEFLILVFIVWEFGWKVKDWYGERREEKLYLGDMAKKLSHLTAEEIEAMKALVLREQQPPDPIALSVKQKIPLILVTDNLLGWSVDSIHRDYMKRWAEEKAKVDS